ncbi:hypothetical protein PUR71_10870 [Streptomyces sp. SP17BM10]|uniref:hypothetical protein n=1 Tax=Streptomyces sp. SP17BM10 TaxID=3002530 RepID=UPI002E78ED4C|nr:hypothetical protein [Streptomyces sp. SP17BM10]MEE1783413.1 hypothetical protein [Streptomyces sp. SP17BM10]
MQSLSVRVALVASTLTAALALIIGHTGTDSATPHITADNGWSAPAPASVTGAADNGWS